MKTELFELQIDCNTLQFITNLQEIKEKVKLQLARYEIEARLLKQEEERLKKEAEVKTREEIQKQLQEKKRIENLVQKIEKQEIALSPTIDAPVQMAERPNIFDGLPNIFGELSNIFDELGKPRKQKFVVIASFEIECVNETAETLKQNYLKELSSIFKSLKNVEVKTI